MEKVDFKKALKHLYAPSRTKVEFVDVPPMNFLMIDGEGNPNTSQSFSDAVQALYALSYALKFMNKKGESGIDYAVMPLEGLWWTEDMSAFSIEDKDSWNWTLMIMQPDFISAEMVLRATEQVRDKKNPVALPLARFSSFSEGKTAQILHIGPFATEGPTIETLHHFIASEKLHRSGKHHEIYLSDIRRSAPEKWRTILRQPVAGASKAV